MNTYRVPSLKTLQRLEWATDAQRQAIRALIRGTTPPDDHASVRQWEAQCYHPLSHLAKLLCALDEVCETSGVEVIETPEGGIQAEYLNTGDTYTTTLIYRYDTGQFTVESWGDLIERKGW